MVFSSLVFLFGFLPIFLAAYFLAPERWRNGVLLTASLLFYAWGEDVFLALMLVSIALNWAFARWIGQAPAPRSRVPVALAVAANLGLLGWFKYANLLADTAGVTLAAIHLPIGISFFTFQALSYVIDVHRGRVAAERSPLHVAVYISMFPQLIAGPIVRYRDVAAALEERHPRLADVATGARRFCVGLGKKVLVANVMGRAADSIFGIPGEQLTPGLAWIGALAYTLQIYFDFSGYSDMAIGLGRMLGFHFLENFDYPYISRSVTEFWRRWHISLSTWFRDYLYIPLGGNRRGSARTYLNLVIVFALCGLWHGASWTFVVWGLYHGAFLVFERAFRGRGVAPWRPLGHALTLVVVIVGWVLFRCETLGHAGVFLRAMVGLAGGDGVHFYALMYLDNLFLLAFAAGLIGSTPLVPALARRLPDGRGGTPGLAWAGARAVALALLFLASALQLSSTAHNPFLYFRF